MRRELIVSTQPGQPLMHERSAEDGHSTQAALRLAIRSTDIDRLCKRVATEVAPFTMVSVENLSATIRLAIDSIDVGRRGDFVECGTWMGGASFAMLLAQRHLFGRIIKPVWMLNSFEGLPQADERDGQRALEYQRNTDAPGYFDNCKAPLERVREAATQFGFDAQEAIIVPGWFNETIPAVRGRLSEAGIALLRVDCDWYEPVSYVYDQLVPLVADGAAIIIDDYYAWDGCVRATHEFLARHGYPWRIRSMEKWHGAWMVKTPLD